jgi:hypothetical protein
MPTRRDFLTATAALLVSRRLFAEPAAALPVITVYKDAGCGCCNEWVKHLSANGFVVNPQDVLKVDDIKRSMIVPEALWSCHTAVVDRYVVEGHVPARDIKKLLAEKPAIQGLAVPGMPNGSPGMEQGGRDAYDVVAFTRDGKTRVFKHYRA